MAEKKIIAVVGATGAQGGGLVRAILGDVSGGFTARALTRDVKSDKAKELAKLGAEVVAADVDDEHVVPGPTLSVYHPFEQQEIWGGRLFVHAHTDPYALVPPLTRIIRELSADQPVERAATLEDVRAEVLTPDRLNALVFGGFAAVALAIAVVGVAGVLAFSVSGRTREFGIRLAIGSQPRHLLAGVIAEGAVMAAAGVVAGAFCGFALARLAGAYFQELPMPDTVPVVGSAIVLLAAALVASALPAVRAARVDVMQALRLD